MSKLLLFRYVAIICLFFCLSTYQSFSTLNTVNKKNINCEVEKILNDIYDNHSVDFSKLSEGTYKEDVIIIKFSRDFEETLKATDFELSQKGYIKTGIEAIDKLNKKHQVVEYFSQIDFIYETSEASHQYKDRHKKWGLHLWYEVKLNGKSDIRNVIEDFSSLKKVRIAEPSIIIKPIKPVESYNRTFNIEKPDYNSKWTPNDPWYDAQWALKNTGQQIPPPDNGYPGGPSGVAGWDINIEDAWDIETGNQNVIVAVIDGGVDHQNADISANMWSNIGPDGNNTDASEHGTHVAGIISAVSNNNAGIAGIAGGSGSNDGVRIMSIDVFEGSYANRFPAAMLYAADNNAAVANMSVGTNNIPDLGSNFQTNLAYFHTNGGGAASSGGVSIAAAGNNNNTSPIYPAYLNDVVAVASHDNRGIKHETSTYGNWVDITAPGVDILSLLPGNQAGFNTGTSMASPHVAGAAALIISNNYGNISRTDVIDAIISNARTDLYDQNPSYTGQLGAGALDIFAALDGDIETYLVTFTVVEDTPQENPIQNANISVNSHQETTNSSGQAIMELRDGNYEANINAAGYQPESASFSVQGHNKSITIRMSESVEEPYNLSVTTAGVNAGEALFEWNTGDRTEWINWDNGEVSGNIGIHQSWWTSAIRFETQDLSNYHGWEIEKVRVFVNDLPTGNAIVKIWQGANGSNLTEVASQAFSPSQNSWNEIELNNTHTINSAEELFIGVEWNDPGEDYHIAGIDDSPTVENKGNLIMLGTVPGTWQHLSNFDISGNWNHQALITSSGKESKLTKNNEKSFAGYNVFLDGSQVANEIQDNSYLFTMLAEGNYTAGVQSVFNNGSSSIQEIDFEITNGVSFSVTFNVIDNSSSPINDAVINIDGTSYSQGQYVFNDVVPGSYNYSVSKSGYITEFGTFEVSDDDKTITVVLEEGEDPTYDINFQVYNEEDSSPVFNAVVTLDGTANPQGDYIFNDCHPGIYNYSISASGYESKSGTVSVTNSNVTEAVYLTPETQQYRLTLRSSPSQGGTVRGGGEFEEGASVTIRATANDGYSFSNWRDNNSTISTSRIYTYTMPGRNVTITANFDAISNICDLNSKEKILVYPNPVNNTAFIESNDIIKKVELFNINGKKIFSEEYLGVKKYDFCVNSFENGLYFIRISTKNNIVTEKINIVK